jgi:hypothetical protein
LISFRSAFLSWWLVGVRSHVSQLLGWLISDLFFSVVGWMDEMGLCSRLLLEMLEIWQRQWKKSCVTHAFWHKDWFFFPDTGTCVNAEGDM